MKQLNELFDHFATIFRLDEVDIETHVPVIEDDWHFIPEESSKIDDLIYFERGSQFYFKNNGYIFLVTADIDKHINLQCTEKYVSVFVRKVMVYDHKCKNITASNLNVITNEVCYELEQLYHQLGFKIC